MSKKTYDIFALVINFSRVDWQPKHMTMNLFEVNQITRQVLAINLIFSFFFPNNIDYSIFVNYKKNASI
jgi:hypothetical protein